MDNNQYKITKKHLKTCDFDHDIYILHYRFPILHFWSEYPIYFEDERILKDFIESAYIFKFNFLNIFDKTERWGGPIKYNIYCRGFNIHLHPKKVLFYHILGYSTHNFEVIETCDEAPVYNGKKLSEAYNDFVKSGRMGLSDTIDEKFYKVSESENG